MSSRTTPNICIANSLVGVIMTAPVPFLGSILPRNGNAIIMNNDDRYDNKKGKLIKCLEKSNLKN